MNIKHLARKLILPATLIGATLFAQKAYSQDEFDESNRPKQEQKKSPSLSEDESNVASHLDKLLDGYLRFEGHGSPSERGFDGSAGIRFNTGDWKPAIYLRSGSTLYDGGDGEDTNVVSTAVIAELSTYLKKGKDFELFFAPHIGFEYDKFSKSIDMDASRAIVGAQIGMASQESGSRLLVSLDGGFGTYDSEFLSGFKNDGSYRTLFAGVEGRQRLWSNDEQAVDDKSEFTLSRELGYEFKKSLYASLEMFLRDDKLGDLQDAQGMGFRFSLPYVINMREHKKDAKGNIYGEGMLWEFTPFIQDEVYKTTSDLSLRETRSNALTVGIHARAQFTRAIGVYGEAGYQWYTLDTKDPGQGIDSKDGKNGLEFKIGGELRF